MIAFTLLLAACGPSDAEKLNQRAKSWQSTIRLTRHELDARRISPGYAKQIAEAAIDGMQSEIEKEKNVPAPVTAYANAVIREAHDLRDRSE